MMTTCRLVYLAAYAHLVENWVCEMARGGHFKGLEGADTFQIREKTLQSRKCPWTKTPENSRQLMMVVIWNWPVPWVDMYPIIPKSIFCDPSFA